MSDYLVSYNLPDYSDEYNQDRSTNETAAGLDLLMFIMVISHILRTQTLRYVILQLILLGNTLVQILSNPLKNQNGAGTVMQCKYHYIGDNFKAKISAAFVIVVGLLAQLECVSADSLDQQCQPQPPHCYPCVDTQYYLDERLSSCQVCLRCPPGLQPDKPCGSDARCIPCNAGVEFSDQTDQFSCFPCRKCDNTINDQPCTTTSNRDCGPCAPGFGYLDPSRKDQCHPCELLGWIGAKQDSCNVSTTTQGHTTNLSTTQTNPAIETTTQLAHTTTLTTTQNNPSTDTTTEANPSTALTKANSIPVTNPPSVTTTRGKPISKDEDFSRHEEDVSQESNEHDTGDNAKKDYQMGKFHIGAKLSGSAKMVLIAFAIVAFVILLVVFCLYKIWSKYLHYQPVTRNSDRIQDERSSGSQADDIENQKSSSTMAADGNSQITSTVYHNSIYQDRDQGVPQNSTLLDFNILGPHYKPKSSAFKSTKGKCSGIEIVRKLSKSESSSALLGNDNHSQDHAKKETATLVKSPSSLSINGGRLERHSSQSLDGIAFDANLANSEENEEEKEGGGYRTLNSQDARPAQKQRKGSQDFHGGGHQIRDSSAPINDLVRPAHKLRKECQDFPDGKHQTRDSSGNELAMQTADTGSRYPIQASQSDGVRNQEPACFIQQTAKVVTTLEQHVPRHSTGVLSNSTNAIIDYPESAKAPTIPSRTRNASIRPLLTRQTAHSSDRRSFSSPPLFGHHNPFWQTSVPSTSSLFDNTGLSVNPSVFNNTRRQSIQSTPLPRNEERNESNLRDAILTPQLSTPTPQPSTPTPQPSAPTSQPSAASTPQPLAPTPQPSASTPQPSAPTPQPSTSTQRDGTFFTNCKFYGPFVLASNSQHSSYTIAESIIDKRNYSNSNPNDAAT